ncbi:hypothetical protein B9J78_05160 [bacterium Unc6]|nr:hypothetical protein [bacterium Unc6]
MRQAKELPTRVSIVTKEKVKVARKICKQQLEMLKDKTHSVKDRIVSFHKPNIRPIVREKADKKVEFGPKISVSHVDRYLLLDKFLTEAYHKSAVLNESISLYEERLGKKPEVVITDKIYGSKTNREMWQMKK